MLKNSQLPVTDDYTMQILCFGLDESHNKYGHFFITEV